MNGNDNSTKGTTMTNAALKAIRTMASEMAVGGCSIKAGDKICTKGGGHYFVREVEWNEIIKEHVLTVSADCPVRGVDRIKIRLTLSCFAA
jgi:hypothetical protein